MPRRDMGQPSTNDTATTNLYTLSLHDALPILLAWSEDHHSRRKTQPTLFLHSFGSQWRKRVGWVFRRLRSEEHTSELQSQSNLVCRLLLEKKNHHSIGGSVMPRRDMGQPSNWV